MKSFFDESAVWSFCKKFEQKWADGVAKSALFGKKEKGQKEEDAGVAAAFFGRIPLITLLEKAIGSSRICAWLHSYLSRLQSLCLWHLLLLLLPPLLLRAFSLAINKSFLLCAVLLLLAGGLAAVFSKKTPLLPLLQGSYLLKKLPFPKEIPPLAPSMVAYFCFCGAAGGAVALFGGIVFGLFSSLGLFLLPAFFGISPLWFFYGLMAMLPIGNTVFCWAMSVGLCVLFLFARAFGNAEGKPLDRMDLLLGTFLLFCGVSTAFSFDRGDSLKVTAMWAGLFLCVFAVRRIVCTEKGLIGSLYAFGVGAVFCGGYGVFQYLSGMVNTTWTDTQLFETIDARIYSTFANPNVFGEYLLFAIPLATGMLLYAKSRSAKILWGGLDLLLLCNMGLTYSRGCYVGLALAAVIFLWHFSKKWLIAGLACAIPLGILLMPQSVMDRILSIGNMSDTSTSFRVYIYIGTVLMLARYWLGGVGIGEGAFNAIYPYYSLPAILTPHSHSLFLQAVCSFGIAGLFYLIWLFIHYQKETARARACASGRVRGLMLSFNILFWGMLLQSVFDYTWYNYRIFQLFWILYVLGLSATEIFKKEELNS